MTTEITKFEDKVGALSISDIRSQVQLIQHVMRDVMKEGEHFGVIPGTGTKPTLLKAGAEKLCLTFRLDPQYEIVERFQGDHLTVLSKCTIYHIDTGKRLGSGQGSCSTKESKYRWRESKRSCPECGKEAIIKGKLEFGGGWLCFKKQGGCGYKFSDDDTAITEQKTGRVENEDVADTYNTVLKMANKRSLVAAVLNVTAASDIFTQDIEDSGPAGDAKVVQGEVIPNAVRAMTQTAIEDYTNAFNEAKGFSEIDEIWKQAEEAATRAKDRVAWTTLAKAKNAAIQRVSSEDIPG